MILFKVCLFPKISQAKQMHVSTIRKTKITIEGLNCFIGIHNPMPVLPLNYVYSSTDVSTTRTDLPR